MAVDLDHIRQIEGRINEIYFKDYERKYARLVVGNLESLASIRDSVFL